jgi:hypothetical protein
LGDVPSEAALNLVIHHLRRGQLNEAHALIKGLTPATPQEYILKVRNDVSGGAFAHFGPWLMCKQSWCSAASYHDACKSCCHAAAYLLQTATTGFLGALGWPQPLRGQQWLLIWSWLYHHQHVIKYANKEVG